MKKKLANLQSEKDNEMRKKLAELQSKNDLEAEAKLAELQSEKDDEMQDKLAKLRSKKDNEMKKKLAELQSQKDFEIFDLQTVLQDAMNIETKLHEDMVQLHTKHWATLLVLCVSFAWNVVQFRRRRTATLRSAETKNTGPFGSLDLTKA